MRLLNRLSDGLLDVRMHGFRQEPPSGGNASRWIRASFAVLGAVVIAAALTAYTYFDKRTPDALRSSVKIASTHLSSLLKIEAGPSNITHEEYVRQADAGLLAIDKEVERVKGRAEAPPTEAEAAALAYMSDVRTTIQSLGSRMRAAIALSTARDRMKENLQDVNSPNLFTSMWALEREPGIQDEITKADDEWRTHSKDVAAACNQLRGRMSSIVIRFGSDAGIDSALLRRVAAKVDVS